MSLTDFVPKRLALNYEPPMIVLEYLVPSTGKLYHHRMKLRRLKPTSTVADQLAYLKKRHGLYFTHDKVKESQVVDLLQLLIKRVK